jgi:hypothetical protein
MNVGGVMDENLKVIDLVDKDARENLGIGVNRKLHVKVLTLQGLCYV